MANRTPAQLDSAAGLWIEALILGMLSVAPLRRPIGVFVTGAQRGELAYVDTRHEHRAVFALQNARSIVHDRAAALGGFVGWESNDCAFGWSEPGR